MKPKMDSSGLSRMFDIWFGGPVSGTRAGRRRGRDGGRTLYSKFWAATSGFWDRARACDASAQRRRLEEKGSETNLEKRAPVAALERDNFAARAADLRVEVEACIAAERVRTEGVSAWGFEGAGRGGRERAAEEGRTLPEVVDRLRVQAGVQEARQPRTRAARQGSQRARRGGGRTCGPGWVPTSMRTQTLGTSTLPKACPFLGRATGGERVVSLAKREEGQGRERRRVAHVEEPWKKRSERASGERRSVGCARE